MKKLTIKEFYELNRDRFGLRPATPGEAGMERYITGRGISRPGLALTGFFDQYSPAEVQVCGSAALAYIRRMKPADLKARGRRLFGKKVPCFIIPGRKRIPAGFKELAAAAGVPVFTSSLDTSHLMPLLTEYLDRYFAERLVVHGSLVDVHGIGVLLTGKSGIGKSEIALDLLERGHRLVSDDAVTLYRKSEGLLIGSGSELLKHYLELRGIGIVDIRSIFGLRAVRQEKRVEVEVQLEVFNRRKHYDRLGLDTSEKDYLGVKLPLITLPVFPGKNITVILEVIALNYILYTTYGYRPAEKLNERLIRLMNEKTGMGL